MPKPKIVVERVPLDYRPVDIPANFPPMPVLYLELIENKDKVKPDLKDKSAQPIFLPERSPILQPMNNNAELPKKDKTPEIYRPPILPSPRDLRQQEEENKPSPESLIHSRLKERMKRKSESREKSPIIQDRHSARERRQEEEQDRKKHRENYREPLTPPREDRREDRREEYRGDRRQEDHRLRQEDRRQVDDWREERREDRREEPPSSPKTKEIRDILGGMKQAAAPLPSVSSAGLPPSLEQITSNEPIHVQGKQVKDITYTASDEVERRRDLMFRFDILKKSYKEANIPEISQFMDLETLDRMYQDTVRRVALDSKVESYRRFLNMGFMGIELLFSNVLKLDMTGFAKQQMASMNSYEKILIELGERSLLEKTKSQFPAEVRLLFAIVMNAVTFVMGKAIMGGGLSKIFGGGGGGGGGMGAIGGLMSGLMGAMGGGGGGGLGAMAQAVGGAMGGGGDGGVPEQAEPPKATGRKMRGPSSINLDDLGSKKTN